MATSLNCIKTAPKSRQTSPLEPSLRSVLAEGPQRRPCCGDSPYRGKAERAQVGRRSQHRSGSLVTVTAPLSSPRGPPAAGRLCHLKVTAVRKARFPLADRLMQTCLGRILNPRGAHKSAWPKI